MSVGEAAEARRPTPRRIGLRARLPLRAGKPAAKGQRTCDIAPPLSKTCVFDLTRGRIVREDQCRQTEIRSPVRRDMEAAHWAVFRVSGPRCSSLSSAARDSANSLPIRPRNRAVGQSDLRRKAQGFSTDWLVERRERKIPAASGLCDASDVANWVSSECVMPLASLEERCATTDEMQGQAFAHLRCTCRWPCRGGQHEARLGPDYRVARSFNGLRPDSGSGWCGALM